MNANVRAKALVCSAGTLGSVWLVASCNAAFGIDDLVFDSATPAGGATTSATGGAAGAGGTGGEPGGGGQAGQTGTKICVPETKRCLDLEAQVCDGQGHWLIHEACSYLCIAGACWGVCTPGSARCDGLTLQHCDDTGQWAVEGPCEADEPVCSNGECVGEGPSCGGVPDNCGPYGAQSCCKAGGVVGGTFNRSNEESSPATVSSFTLDNYEITVARFRKFVNAGFGTQAHAPATGAGAVPSSPDSGWQAAWSSSLAADTATLQAAVKCDATFQTWTDSQGSNDYRPMNCITWLEAFAFCIWDGGRLPTEAEWNYAAAGGSEQRVYPWSVPPESTTTSELYASYWVDAQHGCYGDGVDGCALADLINVGTKPAGNGKWGQADLGGNVWEWVRDSYEVPYGNPCNDCVDLAAISDRVTRGGGLSSNDPLLLTATRGTHVLTFREAGYGARCAR